MPTYQWKTSTGRVRQVDAEQIAFEPGHIVFKTCEPSTVLGPHYRIVLAVQNTHVHDLVQLPEDEQ